MILRNLFSAKQVGILYHFTSLESLPDILKSMRLNASFRAGEMRSFERHGIPLAEKYIYSKPPHIIPRLAGISLTRNKNFHLTHRGIPSEIRLVLDGDKISENYKVVPFDFFSDVDKKKYITENGIIDEFGDEITRDELMDRYDEREELVLLNTKKTEKGKNKQLIPPYLPLEGILISVDFMYSAIDRDQGWSFDRIQKAEKEAEKLLKGRVPVRGIQ